MNKQAELFWLEVISERYTLALYTNSVSVNQCFINMVNKRKVE